MTRAIRKIGVRMSIGDAICALVLLDEKEDSIVEIEWENCEFGRYWVVEDVPADYGLIGLRANTTADPGIITRLGFVFKKFEYTSQNQEF